MREIKFRAWDKLEFDMIYDVLVLSDGTFVLENANRPDYVEKYPGMDEVAPNNFSIMQYIGLKDMNGKEIYEGDIVEVTNINSQLASPGVTRLVVIWNNDRAAFYLGAKFRGGGDNLTPLNFISAKLIEVTSLEIIGNIYQKPELLEIKPNN